MQVCLLRFLSAVGQSLKICLFPKQETCRKNITACISSQFVVLCRAALTVIDAGAQ